jgi:LysM repeat protein
MKFFWRPNRQGPVRTRILWFAVALFSANFLYAPRSGAQDQPEEQDEAAAAHQEKARKSNEARPQSHVYTNDDLRKPQILTEQDRARVEARKKSPEPPETLEPGPSLDANGDSSEQSLGEVARRYRREKAADAAEEASRPKPPAAFPMDLSQPIFATPAPVGPPPSAFRVPLAPIGPPAATSKPRLGRAPLKRDPFSRPVLAPFSSARNPGRTPLIINSAEPSPVAPPSKPPAAVPVKPSIVSPPPAIRGMGPARPSMASPVPLPPASSVAPTSGGDSSIAVQPSDSLWKLSRRFLGRGSHWQDWLSDNPGLVDPQSIQAGTILVVPRPASSAASPTLGQVLVHPGDSLWKIALAHYGDGAEWQCIAGANPALSDPGQIYPGQTLALPARCSSETSKPSR